MTRTTRTISVAVAVVSVLISTGAAAAASGEAMDLAVPEAVVSTTVAESSVSTTVVGEAEVPTTVVATEPEAPTTVAEDPEPVVPVAPAADTVPDTAPAPSAHDDDEEHEEPVGGPTVTVNGQPFHGQADPKLDGCSVTVAVSDLPAGTHEIEGAVNAVEPSGKATLVPIAASFEGEAWTETWALDDLVTDLVQKPNGYRIRVVLTIDDGATKTSRPFWLACGAPQTGNPYVVVLDKQWLDAQGAPVDPPAAVAAGWTMTATSQLGSATCSYPDGSLELECDYENKGSHEGSEEGLYVPGGKKKTFTVTESGLPAGWSNVSGLGTFEPRVLCPRGHDDDDHDDHAAAVTDEEEGGVCEHVVINRQDPPAETTTTTEATTTTQAVTSTTEGGAVAPAGVDQPPASDAGTLARTGSDSAPLVATGLGFVALGAAALGLRRRRLQLSN
jgi:LPXTG-motif cell wall-anchored protein